MDRLTRYRSLVSDSERWADFPFREGDIVVSTPAKCGTTWMQHLCLQLVLDTRELDSHLSEISPWLDSTPPDLDAVLAMLDAQQHRRVLKTHTPLDGLPFDARVTYICIGRDPRDVALSVDNALANVTPEAFADLFEAAGVGPEDVEPPPPDPIERFWRWLDADLANSPVDMPMVLANLLQHLQTFWDRREEPQIELFHYSDLLADLPGQLQHLAAVLAIDVSEERIEQFAGAATFNHMRQHADTLAPEAERGIWQDNQQFFHSGTNGQWRELGLDDAALQRYRDRVAKLASPDLADWVHVGWLRLAG